VAIYVTHTRRSDSSCAIETRIDSQLQKFLLRENSGSMWCSTRKTITRDNRPDISDCAPE